MRKVSLLICLLTVCLGMVRGQRLLPGEKGIEIGVSMAGLPGDAGYSVSGTYSYRSSPKNQWRIGGEYTSLHLKHSCHCIPLEQFALTGGYLRQIWADKRKDFLLTMGFSVLGGYESVNGGKLLLPDGSHRVTRGHFLYGGSVQLEAEWFLTDRMVLLFQMRPQIKAGSESDPFRLYSGAGLRWILP